MGYIVEDFNVDDFSDNIIEEIGERISDQKLSDEDILTTMRNIKAYTTNVIRYYRRVVDENRRTNKEKEVVDTVKKQ